MTTEALNLILDDDAEADSDGELAEPMCPGSDEEFDFDIDDQELFSFNPRYKNYNRYTDLKIMLQITIVMKLLILRMEIMKLTATTASHQVQLLTP